MFILLLVSYGILTEGRSTSTDDVSHTRNKRSVSCSSIDSLKKYLYTSGHTACISPSPSADLSTSGVTSSEITEIVNAHNNYRASESATDMIKMSWDEEIAYLAQKWAENCDTNHDNGYKRRIPGRLSLGQNLAWGGGSKMTWTAAIKLWYDEIAHFTYNGSNQLNLVGHYTQVVWAKSIKIGCGYVYCSNENRHLLACNYGPGGNLNINLPYTQGTSCEDCPLNCANNLCDCNIVCLNGGSLDLSTCTCNCLSGYSGTDCALDCSSKTDPNYCVNQYTTAKCPLFRNVPPQCPHMCQFCPNAGIAVTGSTDGRGALLTFDPTGDGSDNGSSSLSQYTFYFIPTTWLLFILNF